VLPNPNGSLSEKVNSSAIKEANKEVTAIVTNTGGKKKSYVKLTPEQKAMIGRYAAENGVVNIIDHFKRELLEDSFKESTFHRWKKTYILELEPYRRTGKKDRT